MANSQSGNGNTSKSTAGGAGAKHEMNPLLYTEHVVKTKFERHSKLDQLTRIRSGKEEPLTPYQKIYQMLQQFSPLLTQIITGGYTLEDLTSDLRAGGTVSVLLVPQAIAYALLADLPPVYGLYCALAPVLVYSLTSTSRHTCIGPFALVSLLVSDLVHSSLPERTEPQDYIQAVLILSLLTGLIQILMGLLRFGFMVRFLSDSVVSGFTSGAAILIMCSQLKHLVGLPLPRTTPVYTIYHFLTSLPDIHWLTAALSVISVGSLTGLKTANQKYFPSIMLPEQLVVVVLMTLLSWVASLGDHGVKLVGVLPSDLPAPAIPQLLPLQELRALAPSCALLAVASFVLTVSLSRQMAKKGGYQVHADQELIALGCSNVIGSVFKAYPACGSLSRTAVCVAAGGRTQGHGTVQAAAVVLALIALTKALAPLPYCVLAALVVSALQSMLKISDARALYRVSRGDFWVWTTTFLATVLLGVQTGVALGVVASLVWLLHQTARPFWAELGRLPGTHIYRNVRRYKGAARSPGVLVLRFDAPLHFANKDYFGEILTHRELRFSSHFFDHDVEMGTPHSLRSVGVQQTRLEDSIRDPSHHGEVAAGSIAGEIQPESSSFKTVDLEDSPTAVITTSQQQPEVLSEIRHATTQSGGEEEEEEEEPPTVILARVPLLCVVLEASGILNIDAPALEMLRGLVKEYKKREPPVQVLLSGQKGPLRLALRKAGLVGEDGIGEDDLFVELHDAVRSAESRVNHFLRSSENRC